jgi:hypothetical protein
MRREALDGFDASLQGIPLAEDPDRRGAGLNDSSQRPGRLIAHEDDGVSGVGKRVLEMVVS